MGGLFGVVSRENCALDLFFGVDYHSHLGTSIGGLAVLTDNMIKPICHDISNSQFKTEFNEDFEKLNGELGIGVISSKQNDKQPLVFRSKHGVFALCTDGLIKNADALASELIDNGVAFKDSIDKINQTELVGELICGQSSITKGISEAFKKIQGTISLLLLSEEEKCIYACSGVFPLVVGKKTMPKGDNWAVASETTAFPNLKYEIHTHLRYRDIVSIGDFGIKMMLQSQEKIVFCPFLHIYFDFPTSNHYGINGEIARERCGGFLLENDDIKHDLIMGVADSGIPHAHGYAKRKLEQAIEKSKIAINTFKEGNSTLDDLEVNLMKNLALLTPLRRPVIKFTPAWGRSYIPSNQSTRDMVAYYKQIPNSQLITNQSIVLVDDSIRRGTQLRRFIKEKILTYKPKKIHVRVASPPQLFVCYFDENTKDSELIARQAIDKIAVNEQENLNEYQNVSSPKYRMMVDMITEFIGSNSLKFISLSEMIKAIIEAPGNLCLKEENLCTYCWTGKKPIFL